MFEIVSDLEFRTLEEESRYRCTHVITCVGPLQIVGIRKESLLDSHITITCPFLLNKAFKEFEEKEFKNQRSKK